MSDPEDPEDQARADARTSPIAVGLVLGAAAGICTTLADFGALWLWLPTWLERAEVLLRMLVFQAAAGAAVGALLGAVVHHGALPLARRPRGAWLWPLALTLLVAPAAIAVASRLFEGAYARSLGPQPVLISVATVGLLVGAYAAQRIAFAMVRGAARGRRRRIALAAATLVLFVALTKADQRVLPKLYEYLHATVSVVAWLLAGLALALAVPLHPGTHARAQRMMGGRRPWMLAALLVGLFLANVVSIGSRFNARVALLDSRASNSRSLMQGLSPVLALTSGEHGSSEAVERARARRTARAAELREDLSGAPVLENAHVLMVTIDALRADHLGFYGYERELSPNLDALAAESTVFERAYAAAPHSSYSLSSLMTAAYVHQLVEQSRPLPTETLASTLDAAGYHTAGFYTRGVFHTEGERMQVYDEIAFGFVRHDHANRDAESMTDATLDEAARVLARDDPPTLFWSHYFDVHEPYRDTSIGTSDVDRYDGEIRNVDREFARLLAGLRERLTRPLIVVVTADHGEEFRDHGGLFHGSTLYEEQIRVPLLLHVPGVEGRRSAAPAQLVDVAPTLLALLGQAPAETMMGRDLRGRLAADPDPAPPAFGAVSYKKMVVRWPHKLIADLRFGLYELYDLSADPRERDNLASAQPELLEDLRGEIYAWIDDLGQAEAMDPQQRALALGRARDRRAIEPLAALVEDDTASEDIRVEAAKMLTKLTSRTARPALRRAMEDPSSAVAAEAAIALGRQRDEHAHEALRRLVHTEDPAVRTRAAISLARLRDPAAVPALIDALRVSEERYDREEAVRWLGRLGDPQALEPLLQILPDLRLRPLAIIALGDLGDPRAFGALARTLRWETHSTVRDAVARALGRLRDPRGISLVVPLLADVDLKYPGEALVRLDAIGGAVGGVDAEALRRRRGFGDCEVGPLDHDWNYLARTVCTTTADRVQVPLTPPAEGANQPTLLAIRARRADSGAATTVQVTAFGRTHELSFDGESAERRIQLPRAPEAIHLTLDQGVRLELDHVLTVATAESS